MKDIIFKMFDKITSYEIFGNFIPGAAFYLINRAVYNYEIYFENTFDRVLSYYLIGLCVGRIGELFLKDLKNRSGSTYKEGSEEYFSYIIASKEEPFIRVLHETSICYQSLVGVFIYEITVVIVHMCLEYKCHDKKDVYMLLISLISTIVFYKSYLHQETIVRKRVDCFISKLNSKNTDVSDKVC